MTIIGLRRANFTPKGSDAMITGYNLYLTYPATGPEAEGMACERIYMSDEKLAKCGYVPSLGDEVNITYNRYGKPEFILPVRCEKN